jgi:hypothetical protein
LEDYVNAVEDVKEKPEGVIRATHSYKLVFDDRVYLHVETKAAQRQQDDSVKIGDRGELKVKKSIKNSNAAFELQSVIMRPGAHFVFYDFDTSQLYNDTTVTTHSWYLNDDGDVQLGFGPGSTTSLAKHGLIFLYQRGERIEKA